MDSFDYVIVGSGPAGVAAGRRLEGKDVCIVDVGDLPQGNFPHATLRGGLASGDFESLLGHRWEMLGNLIDPGRVHAKLRLPNVGYILGGKTFRVFDDANKCLLQGAGSYAAGGMSNAWGAQLFRYTDKDLDEAGDWPFKAAALDSYYADLEAHIGIAGEVDDMHSFLGETTGMLPPAPIVSAAEYLLTRYRMRRKRTNEANFRLGRSRLAVLTQPHRGYSQHEFGETEFFSTEQSGIYTARRTLKELITRGSLTYLGGHRLVAYRESAEHVEIDLCVGNDDVIKTIRARHLLLGCGTMQTARLVLLNKQEFGRKLPFIDHPPTLLPLFIPKKFGAAFPSQSFPIQLVATLGGLARSNMISFYYPGALLWADLLADIPLPLNSAIRLLPNLIGGMLVAQIWETSKPVAGNQLSVESDGSIRIDYPHRLSQGNMIQKLLAALRPLGAYSLQRLASMSPPGWGFHHAACLPMRHYPGPFETHIDGRLWDSKRVRIVDGSVLPSLPAKNHSLTLMANAARIADETLKCGY
ncbi:MAG: Choline dehydrogenase [Herbaspirillum sp.]|nr:Choline dehydrogenase [Herbaspirillum sp.]